MANPELVSKLEGFFGETIQQMDRQFTSHEFFLKLLRAHQVDYVAALASYSDKNAPFKDLHYEIANRLHKLEGKSITAREKNYPSQDIFGIASTTVLWRKL